MLLKEKKKKAYTDSLLRIWMNDGTPDYCCLCLSGELNTPALYVLFFLHLTLPTHCQMTAESEMSLS